MDYFELIRIALKQQDCLKQPYTDEEWQQVYDFAQKQSLTGVLFSAIEHLPKDQVPDMDILMDWLGQTEYVRTRNIEVYNHCLNLHKEFKGQGLRYCILKGQGVANLYSKNFIDLRQCGDIDVWMDACSADTMEYVKCHSFIKEFNEKHISFHIFEDTAVELHWIPVKLDNPFRNKFLMSYFESERNRQFSNIVDGLCFPTVDFQLVHQLLHVYGHYLYEGVGLRQLMDLYFAQKACMKEFPEKKKDILQLFSKLGLMKFVAATQWVQGEVFGLSREGMICESDDKEGKQLLEEIMVGGNFGQYDERNHVSGESFVGRFFRRWNRKFRMFRFDPLGTLLMPYERIKLEIWMRKVRRQYGV